MAERELYRVCPICGQDNNCKHGQGNCWCETEEFPKYVLALIPEDKKGKACICKSCLEKLKNKGENLNVKNK